MAKTVAIPDELHDTLATLAAREGLSVDALVERALEVVAVLDRVRSRPPVNLGISAAELIREGREERDRQLMERWSSSTPRR